MATHYIDNMSSSPYYFNANNATTSQSSRTYSSSGYSSYPVGGLAGSYLSSQSNQYDNSYNSSSPQQYQSVAGFNRNTTQQRYQTPQSPAPQVRASVRIAGSQDQYSLPNSTQPVRITPQQHHFQFDPRQQSGRPTGPAVVYQTPGAAQYTHRNVDLWTEGPSQGQDNYVQAQRVSVRSVSTGSPQQSHSVSPQRPQDHLQQYYSQLTPEQHQQLLRQQQLQRQQEQRVSAQQISPSTQHRSTAGFNEGRQRSDSERQRRDEQDYYAAQHQIAAQRAPQNEQPSHPVGIRNLMNKFSGPAPALPNQPRSRSTTTRHYSSSSYTTSSGPNQTNTRSLTSHSMTYSALPKPVEPPVNSVEYYQMQLLQGKDPFTNIQQAAAPPHIQHSVTGVGGLRDRFKTGSLSDDFNRPQVVNRQPPSPPQQQQSGAGGNNLVSLRNQYINRANESLKTELPDQPVQNISRTIVGEDLPKDKRATQPPATVLQAPLKQQEAPATNTASSPTQDTNVDEGVSSF